jgi:hypothetical protein
MDDRIRAESEARLFSAAASASKDDLSPTPPSSPEQNFSHPSPPTLYSVLATPDFPEAKVWEVGSVEAGEIEAESARLHHSSPIQMYGWH